MVGPESAGAHPGPACYRKGNTGQFIISPSVSVLLFLFVHYCDFFSAQPGG